MMNGPSFFGESFHDSYCLLRKHASSHTFSPFLKVCGLIFLTRSCILIHARSCAAKASIHACFSSFSLCLAVGTFVSSKAVGTAFGSYPIRSWNGEVPVVEWGRWL